jgi:hypothetical protein
LSAVLLLLILALIFFRRRSAIALDLRPAEIVLVAMFCMFPALAFLLATFGTHFVDSRYMQPAIIGVAPLVAILIAPLLESGITTKIVVALLFAAVAVSGVCHILLERQKTQMSLATLTGSPDARAFLDGHPGQPILISNHTAYEMMLYYAPRSIAPRLRFVVAPEKSMVGGVSSDVSAQLQNMLTDHVSDVVPYSAVSQHGMEQIFLLYPGPLDWTGASLENSQAEIKHIGRMCDGNLASIHFP